MGQPLADARAAQSVPFCLRVKSVFDLHSIRSLPPDEISWHNMGAKQPSRFAGAVPVMTLFDTTSPPTSRLDPAARLRRFRDAVSRPGVRRFRMLEHPSKPTDRSEGGRKTPTVVALDLLP
jgi:hypothetical protein